ncbi:MAG: PAS domain S-box protein [Thermoplasmata archaeon]|nr:PAS domain S-box protein [Thermoplasmata archaeon]
MTPGDPRAALPFGVLFDDSPAALALFDGEGALLRLNRAAAAITGWRESDDPSRPGGGVDPLPKAVRAALLEAIASGTPASLRSVRAQVPGLKEPSFLDIEIRPLPRGGADGRFVQLVVSDAGERVREKGRAALFYESFLTSNNAIEVTDLAGRIVDVNPAFERIYGYSKSELLGQRPNVVQSGKTPLDVYQRMWADLLDPARGHWSGEMVNRDKAGKEHPVFLTITAVRSESGETTHYVGVAIDRTEQRAWEEGAARSEKLASLGQLAAGVAHEVNTPLANVLLVTESIRRRTEDPWVRSRADRITDQVEVASRIVRGLLDFARRSETMVAPLELSTVVKEAVEFLGGKQSPDVELRPVFPEEPIPIRGDRGQLIQVLTNLINNSYEAMGGSGRVTVVVRRAGERAEVEVSDTGPGIPPEALPHIFEPFFTTKPEGQGTGLGLAICHGIMQSHGGGIRAFNSESGGAVFVLDFPLQAPLRQSP